MSAPSSDTYRLDLRDNAFMAASHFASRRFERRMSLSENRYPPPIKSGAGIFRDMLLTAIVPQRRFPRQGLARADRGAGSTRKTAQSLSRLRRAAPSMKRADKNRLRT